MEKSRHELYQRVTSSDELHSVKASNQLFTHDEKSSSNQAMMTTTTIGTQSWRIGFLLISLIALTHWNPWRNWTLSILFWLSFGLGFLICASFTLTWILFKERKDFENGFQLKYKFWSSSSIILPYHWIQFQKRREREEIPPNLPNSISKVNSQLLESIFQLLSRDFVLPWYSLLSPCSAFPNLLTQIQYSALTQIHQRLAHVDFVHFTIHRILPFVTSHINECRSAERIYKGSDLINPPKSNKDPKVHGNQESPTKKSFMEFSIFPSLTDSDDMENSLAQHYFGGKLHRALTSNLSNSNSLSSKTTAPSEIEFLKTLVNSILPLTCPSNEIQSNSFKILVREILIQKILIPLIESLSDPDYWNQRFVDLSNHVIKSRDWMKKMELTLSKASSVETELERQDFGSVHKTFDDFLRVIRGCENLFELLQIRDVILGEIERKSADVGKAHVESLFES